MANRCAPVLAIKQYRNSFSDTVAEPLLLGGSRRGAEADRHSVVGVHQTNRDRVIATSDQCSQCEPKMTRYLSGQGISGRT
jgi:hypothetical protein